VQLAERLTGRLRNAGAARVQVVGSLLRGEQLIGDVDLLVEGDLLTLAPLLGEVVEAGASRSTVLVDGQQVNLFHGTEDEWGAQLFYLTGPSRYVIAYRMKAKRKGWLLNQHGLFDGEGRLLEARSEERIYELLGKKWKEPCLRGR